MKTQLIKTTFKTIIMMFFISLAVSSCKKDDDTKPVTLKEKLAGKWEITSFNVGGTEYMGFVLDNASLQYDAYTGAEGSFKQTVLYTDGENDETLGTYSVVESTKLIKMSSDGELIEATFNITQNDQLELTGEKDGEVVKIKATRK